MWPPGAGDQAGPDAGLVMSRCAIQTRPRLSPAQARGLSIMRVSPRARPGGENMSRLRTGFCEQGVSVVVR